VVSFVVVPPNMVVVLYIVDPVVKASIVRIEKLNHARFFNLTKFEKKLAILYLLVRGLFLNQNGGTPPKNAKTKYPLRGRGGRLVNTKK
jgi:hypothetical protein